MIEIRVLGGLDIQSDGVPVGDRLLSQPRPSALLGFLAVAGCREFVRRDQLAVLFWPESCQDYARANLRKLLLMIRRSLGKNILTARGDEEVRLNTEVVWSDAAEFMQTLRTLEFDRAIELYRGSVLEGFTLEGARAFQDWLDRTRRFFAREAVKLALRSAELLAEANARTQAGDVARFVFRIEPDLEDEHQLRKLLVILDRLGDRIAAIGLYDRFSQRVWKEYRVAPAKETRELIERIKNL